MTKRTDFDFIGLYSAILKDVGVYFPNDLAGWNRDLASLSRLSSIRGLSIFTMDLPALGKILDRALADGLLRCDGAHLSRRRSPTSMIPRLFQGLWMRLFDDNGCRREDIDPNVVLFLRTLLYVGKNLHQDCAPRYLYEATNEYFDIENALPPPPAIWEEDGELDHVDNFGHLHDFSDRPDLLFGLREQTEWNVPLVLDEIQRTADRVSTEFGGISPDELEFRHGPGAVSDLRSGSYKYSFPNWSPRLEHLFPYDRYGNTHIGVLEGLTEHGFDIDFKEPISRLIAVPKTQKGPRLIAAEPTANQWIQQGVRNFLYTRISRTSLRDTVDFRRQQYSRDGALAGSLDGSLATVDLKSASDRLSCCLVQRIFRRNKPLLGMLIASRTRFMLNPIDVKNPSIVRLRKFSTQGSALTFPIQSIVFAVICIGVGRHLTGLNHATVAGKVRVFGDDIVVPRNWEPLLRHILTCLGLKVNLTKTFTEGYFRESCGMDAWMGYDVTPPHVTFSPTEPTARALASNIAVSNNFHWKGFWHAADWIRTTVGDDTIFVVGPRSGMFGFKSFVGTSTRELRKRFNDATHQEEVLGTTVICRSKVLKQNKASAMLQYFTEMGHQGANPGEPNIEVRSVAPASFIDYESGVAIAGTPLKRRTWVPAYLLDSVD